MSNYTLGGSATTIYVGGILEKVTTSTGTDFRHLIRAGNSTIIVSRQSSGANNTYYVTSDHLGSSAAITNSSGGILVNSSFGAFGNRRGANWTGSPSMGDWSAIASTTRSGFTEQTMLDNLGLTHMNGRVYDQVVGRFLSADPLISEPLNTQNYNRYSYVYNNPLSAVDPSGFQEEDADDRRRGVRISFSVGGLGSYPEPGMGWFYQTLRGVLMEKPDWQIGSPPEEVLDTMISKAKAEADWNAQHSWHGEVCHTWSDLVAMDAPAVDTNLYHDKTFLRYLGKLASWVGWPTEKTADGMYVNPATNDAEFSELDRQNAVALTALSAIDPVARAMGPAARTAAVGGEQLTVIGHNPEFVKLAQAKGANYMQPSLDWTWEKQGEYMRGVIASGDNVLIASPLRAGDSVTRHEIKQLIKSGYAPSQPGSMLLIKTRP